MTPTILTLFLGFIALLSSILSIVGISVVLSREDKDDKMMTKMFLTIFILSLLLAVLSAIPLP